MITASAFRARFALLTLVLIGAAWLATVAVPAKAQGDNPFLGNPGLSPGEQKGVFVFFENGLWNVVFSGGPKTSDAERNNGNARFIGSVSSSSGFESEPEIVEGFQHSKDFVRLEDQETLIDFRSLATAEGFDHFRFADRSGQDMSLFLARTVNIPLDPVPVFLGGSRTRAGSLPLALKATVDTRRAYKKAFPRLGNLQNGKTPRSYSDSAYISQVARFDLILLGKTYRVAGRAAGEIKTFNPAAFVGAYTNIATVPLKRNSTYHNALRDKLSSEEGPQPNGTTPDWWLREKVEVVDGELLGDGNGDGFGDIVEVSHLGNGRTNATDWTQPDANGDRWPEWKISNDYRNGMNDPDFDFWHFDAGNYNVRAKGFKRGVSGMDFSGGRTEDPEVINQAWRDGYLRAWNRLEALRPDVYIIANHDWYRYADQQTGALPPGNGFYKRIDGGVLEDVMRPDKGFELKFGWKQVYDWYRFSMDYFRTRDLTFFTVAGDLTHSPSVDGTAVRAAPEDYQWFRYTFGTCLLQDAYYVYSASDYPAGSVLWFDEYDRAGADTTSWMGLGIAGPSNPGPMGPVDAWKQGVYRRDFENAVVLVNPRGNGRQTVNLENGLRRLRGQQDPVVNNGQAVRDVTLEDGDGIVLVRQALGAE